jgi:uncharacterized membrane protein YedE/YeeE
LTIDWAAFTPYASLFGGVLIGISAAMLVLLNGRVAGVSGIVGSLLRPTAGDVAWRVAFIVGLLSATLLATIVGRPPTITVSAGYPLLIVCRPARRLRHAPRGGCTSGHGVCGISRFSMRSVVATLVFMVAGFVAVYLLRHVFAG